MSDKPGLGALDICQKQVTVTIRNNLKEISGFFFKDIKIIERPLWKEVNDPQSRETKDKRAEMLYSELSEQVEGDDSRFLLFLDYLRKYPTKYGNTVKQLEEAYGDGTSRPTPADPIFSGASAQPAPSGILLSLNGLMFKTFTVY